MSESITIVPANGRDYKSKKQVQEAWDNNEDFKIAGPLHLSGKYINKRDVEHYSPDAIIWARYVKLTRIVQVR